MRVTQEMIRPGSVWVVVLMAALSTVSTAQSIVVFDAPGANATNVAAINNSGDVAGTFYDTSQNTVRGFVREQNGRFTVFDAPNVPGNIYPNLYGSLSVASINDAGDILGTFPFVTQVWMTRTGFVRDRKADYTAIFDAGPRLDFTGTRCINNRGDIVGVIGGVAEFLGFLRDRDGELIPLRPTPDSHNVFATGINNSGQVVGYEVSSYPNNSRAFVLDRKGNVTIFNVPNSSSTNASSINERGDVTGTFTDSSQNRIRGFVREWHGAFTALTFRAHPPGLRR
jgi:uncharacterized membrane protein